MVYNWSTNNDRLFITLLNSCVFFPSTNTVNLFPFCICCHLYHILLLIYDHGKALIQTEILNGIINKRIDNKRITFRRTNATKSGNDKIIVRRMIVMIAPVIIHDRPAKIRIIIFNKIYFTIGQIMLLRKQP